MTPSLHVHSGLDTRQQYNSVFSYSLSLLSIVILDRILSNGLLGRFISALFGSH